MARPRRSKLTSLRPMVSVVDTRTARPPAKTADEFYSSPEHLTFRQAVLQRAGYRCEAIENGSRCGKAAPAHRLFADHIKEIQDGGDKLDPVNGQCLCGSHHTLKTSAERNKRAGRTLEVRHE
jgi:5-methylcytosine-specific restriction protein A